MRNLISLTLIGLSLFGCAPMGVEPSKEFSQNLLPENLKDYRKRGVIIQREINSGKTLFHQHLYYLDNSGNPKVMELYLHMGYDSNGKSIYSTYPFIYGLDLNGDSEFGHGEMLLDKKMDGLNGNEEILEEDFT